MKKSKKNIKKILAVGITTLIMVASLMTISIKMNLTSSNENNDTPTQQTTLQQFYSGIKSPIGTTFYIGNTLNTTAGALYLGSNYVDSNLVWTNSFENKILWRVIQSSANPNTMLNLVNVGNAGNFLCRNNDNGDVGMTISAGGPCGITGATNYTTDFHTNEQYNGNVNQQSFSLLFSAQNNRLNTNVTSSGTQAKADLPLANTTVQASVWYNDFVVINSFTITRVGFTFLTFTINHNSFGAPSDANEWDFTYKLNTGNNLSFRMSPISGTYEYTITVPNQLALQTIFVRGRLNAINTDATPYLFIVDYRTPFVEMNSITFNDTNLVIDFTWTAGIHELNGSSLVYLVLPSSDVPSGPGTSAWNTFNPLPVSGVSYNLSIEKPLTTGDYVFWLTYSNQFDNNLNNALSFPFTFTQSTISTLTSSNVTFTKFTVNYNFVKSDGSPEIFQKLNTNAYTSITPTNQNGANSLNVSGPTDVVSATNNFRLNNVASDVGAQLLTIQMPEVSFITPVVVDVNTIRLTFTWNQGNSTLPSTDLRWNIYLADQTPLANGWQQFATPPVSGSQTSYDLPAPTANGTYRIAIAYQQDLTDFRFSQGFNFTLIPGVISNLVRERTYFNNVNFTYNYAPNGSTITPSIFYKVVLSSNSNEVIPWTVGPNSVTGNNNLSISDPRLNIATDDAYRVYINNTQSETGALTTTFAVPVITLNAITSIGFETTITNFTYSRPAPSTPGVGDLRYIVYQGSTPPSTPSMWNTIDSNIVNGAPFPISFPTPTIQGEWKIAFGFLGMLDKIGSISTFDLYNRNENINTTLVANSPDDRNIEYRVNTTTGLAHSTNWKIGLYLNNVLVPGSERLQISGTFEGLYDHNFVSSNTIYEIRVSVDYTIANSSSTPLTFVQQVETGQRQFIPGQMRNGTATSLGNQMVEITMEILWNDSNGNLNWRSSLNLGKWFLVITAPPVDKMIWQEYTFTIIKVPLGMQNIEFEMFYGRGNHIINNVNVT